MGSYGTTSRFWNVPKTGHITPETQSPNARETIKQRAELSLLHQMGGLIKFDLNTYHSTFIFFPFFTCTLCIAKVVQQCFFQQFTSSHGPSCRYSLRGFSPELNFNTNSPGTAGEAQVTTRMSPHQLPSRPFHVRSLALCKTRCSHTSSLPRRWLPLSWA